jgi:hypothetical protein
MNTLKGWIATTFLLATITLSAVPANAGIIFGGSRATTDPCTEVTKDSTNSADLGGVIYGGLTSVVSGLTGIIFGGSLSGSEPVQNCGIIYGG